MINCIAIDDEPLALDLIRGYMQKVPYLNPVGEFGSAQDALEIIRERKVDLIYLDINMPDISGIEFIKSIPSPPKFVLTTAYDQFAIEGFELSAMDYLLKPFSFQRFLKATERVREQGEVKTRVVATPEEYIMVKVEHYIHRVPVDSIHYVEGYKDYVKIYTDEKEPILTIKSLKSLEELLPSGLFLRIHRSFIVSVNKIKTYRNGKVKLKDTFLPIGESYKDQFVQIVLKDHL
ncbi:MAG: response regulator transcription factor [Cyclobacteriaceae bacterium]|nr:response regulator transcription factor [Cyclobacteriaceae bacterium HetDA_MAG_MS6]